MKKFALVIAVMALVLLVGQTAFAAGSNAGLKLGYAKGNGEHTIVHLETADSYSAFQIGISASYYTQINASATLKLNLGFGKTFCDYASNAPNEEYKTFMLNFHAFIKYDVYNGYGINVAPQIGVILDSERNSDSTGASGDYKRAVIFLAPGIFVRLNVVPKIEIYLEIGRAHV